MNFSFDVGMIRIFKTRTDVLVGRNEFERISQTVQLYARGREEIRVVLV